MSLSLLIRLLARVIVIVVFQDAGCIGSIGSVVLVSMVILGAVVSYQWND